MLSAIKDMSYAVESISMGIHMHYRSSNQKAQYQTTAANTGRELIHLEAELTSFTNYNVTVAFTILINAVYRLMP